MKLYISYLPIEYQKEIENKVFDYVTRVLEKPNYQEIIDEVMSGTLTDIEELMDISKYKYILSKTITMCNN